MVEMSGHDAPSRTASPVSACPRSVRLIDEAVFSQSLNGRRRQNRKVRCLTGFQLRLNGADGVERDPDLMSGFALERMQESFQRTFDSACAEYRYFAHRISSCLYVSRCYLIRLSALVPLFRQFLGAGGSSVKP